MDIATAKNIRLVNMAMNIIWNNIFMFRQQLPLGIMNSYT